MAKAAPKGKGPDVDDDLGVGDPNLGQGLELDIIDDLSDLIGPEDVNATLRALRTFPTFIDGKRSTGWLPGRIPPDVDILDWIAERYGGGEYKICKFAGPVGRQKFIQSRTVTIVGDPRVSPPFTQTPATTVPNPAPAELGTLEGISLDGDDRAFFKRLERITLLQAFIEKIKGPDVNSVLLSKLLELTNNKPASGIKDMLETLEGLETLRSTIGGGSGGGGSETSWLDIIKEGVKGLSTMVQKAQPAGYQPPPQPAPAQITAPAAQPGAAPMPTAIQVAQQSVAAIVAAFLEEPPLTTEQTVEVLKTIVPAGFADSIKDNRTTLTSMAMMELHQRIEPDPELDQNFSLHFNSVFDSFLASQQPAA